MSRENLRKLFSEKQTDMIMGEWPRVKDACFPVGVDPCFVMAIRLAENGPPGTEFGVKSIPAKGYDKQLKVTVVSVRNFLVRRFTGIEPAFEEMNGRVILSYPAVERFGARWAPTVGVGNAEAQLNKNWAKNVWQLYRKLAMAAASKYLS